jgi:hypothetical protein
MEVSFCKRRAAVDGMVVTQISGIVSALLGYIPADQQEHAFPAA